MNSAVVCREVFDENSQPSAEEISEYAQQIGIDPDSEGHLLPLAKDGLMQALPPPWKAYFDEKLETHYYYNDETKKTQWEHPLDRVYREMVKKARDASMHDDTCASVQELPTSEENTKNVEKVETKAESEDEDLSIDSSENASDAKESNTGTGSRRLQPFGRPPLAPVVRPADKKLSELRISPLRRSVDSSLSIKPSVSRGMPELNRPFERPKLFKQQSEIIDLKMHVLNSPEEENCSPFVPVKSEKGFTLTGKGSVFLKMKKTDLPSPDTEKSLPLDSMTKSDPPKGILREKVSDILQKKTESAVLGKARATTSFEEDRKSVRFNLDSSGVETTVSPGSNSSSEQNDGHSVITSPPIPSPQIAPSSPVTSGLISSPFVISSPKVPSSITLSPLVTRPPLPPRPQLSIENASSPKESSPRISISGSDRESNESDKDRGTSPRRRLLRPPAADYIKPDLFQKNFHKISDLVRPGDIEPSSTTLDEPGLKEMRPRSPMIPQKNKISINLMESIDSETSIDSPDKEFANFDLNDLDESQEVTKDEHIADNKTESSSEEISEKIIEKSKGEIDSLESKPKLDSTVLQIKSSRSVDSAIVPQIKLSKLELLKTHPKITNSEETTSKISACMKDEVLESKINSRSDSLDHSKETSSQIRVAFSPQLKTSPSLSVHSNYDLKSPRNEIAYSEKSWSSPLKPISPLNKAIIATQIKSSDSNTSIHKVTNPRLDGLILSQNKNVINKGSDNVVVMYQFEDKSSGSLSKSLNDSSKDTMERSKGDERRRLELALQKQLEEIRAEWASKERRLRGELIEEFREAEERFTAERRKRLAEQAERHRREMEEALQEAEKAHASALKTIVSENEIKLKKETELAERKFNEAMAKLREEHSRIMREEQNNLKLEGSRAAAEAREQLGARLARERARALEEGRAGADALRAEHAARAAELRHDYRAEVERLRAQHACHLEELRARAAALRRAPAPAPPAPAPPAPAPPALADKYRCLKEKYARLKHDVKMSIERRNKRRELSMTTGSETEKSNSHKATQPLERCKEVNETVSASIADVEIKMRNNNPTIKYNDNETSLSESNAQKSFTDNNNDDWRNRKETATSPESSRAPRTAAGAAVAFREPPGRRARRREPPPSVVTTDYQDSSDATTADEKPKDSINGGHGRRRCFTRLKSASTSRLNYSPKRGDGWSSPLESLRQQLRKLDDLEDQFPDLACQPSYSLRYPFAELVGVEEVAVGGASGSGGGPELEFVRHRALVEREGMRRARAALRRRRAALLAPRAARPPAEEREATELEVALHRARALLGEKEIRLRHIERALRRLPPPAAARAQEGTTSDGSSGSEEAEAEAAAEAEAEGAEAEGAGAGGAVLRSLRALHADVRDIWLALDARRPPSRASPETSSCNAATASRPRMNLSAEAAPEAEPDGVAERARGLRAWLQAP